MLLRYFAEDGAHDVQVPDGSRVWYRSHVQVGVETFLDDLLMVPHGGRAIPIPGEIIPALARAGMYGMTLIGLEGTPLCSSVRGAFDPGDQVKQFVNDHDRCHCEKCRFRHESSGTSLVDEVANGDRERA